MTDQEVKIFEILIPSAFGLISTAIVVLGTIIVAKINKIHTKIDGLLEEKTQADKAIGKIEGVQQEKADQKDRDDLK